MAACFTSNVLLIVAVSIVAVVADKLLVVVVCTTVRLALALISPVDVIVDTNVAGPVTASPELIVVSFATTKVLFNDISFIATNFSCAVVCPCNVVVPTTDKLLFNCASPIAVSVCADIFPFTVAF